MRWIALASVVLVFAAAPAAAAPKRDCGPAAAATLRESATIRVYFTKQRSSWSYYACWRRGGLKPVLLTGDTVEAPDSVGWFRLRGRFLAYRYTACTGSGCDFVVTVLDVPRRRDAVSTDFLLGKIRTLVATRGGAAAFLATDGRDRYVQKLDSLGVEEIDRGPHVRLLTLQGGRLHWLNGTGQRDDRVAHTRRCGPPGAFRTEALSSQVRVYFSAPYGDEEHHHFACLLGGGKPLFLGADLPGTTAYGYFGDFLPAGRHVFFFEYDCGFEGCSTTLYSADLMRRKQRSGSWRYHDQPTVYPNRRGFAAELFTSRSDIPSSDSSTYALYSFDSRGETLLDESAGIDPESIAVYRDAVVWRDNGEQRSAPLR